MSGTQLALAKPIQCIRLFRHRRFTLIGLATLAHSSASLSTQEAIGTLAYMAPEQIERHPRAASDQYALGVVVYEWLCGSRPFVGSVSEVMVQQQYGL
ncbi:MAG: protein kinase domain-containing protein [Ktedonobacteraceae bacterium]